MWSLVPMTSSPEHSVGHVLYSCLGLLYQAEYLFSMGIKDLACTREKYLLADPVKELFAEFIFKGLYLLAHSRLGEQKLLGGAAYAPGFSYFFKI